MENKTLNGTKRASALAAVCELCRRREATERIRECDTNKEVCICCHCDRQLDWQTPPDDFDIHTQQLKGGDENMENQDDNTAVLCPTKAGNGFKLVVNGVWYYTAKRNVWGTLRKGQSCVFRTIDDSKGAGRSGDGRKPLPQRATTRDLDYSDPEFVMAAAPAQ